MPEHYGRYCLLTHGRPPVAMKYGHCSIPEDGDNLLRL